MLVDLMALRDPDFRRGDIDEARGTPAATTAPASEPLRGLGPEFAADVEYCGGVDWICCAFEI